jgi:VWFA-related protein
MLTARVLFVSTLLLSVAVWAQTKGGGHSSGSTSSTPSPSPSGAPVASGASIPASFPTADEEGKIEFRTQAILVQVPVIVNDKNGGHVHGLAKTDFHIFENGKERPVSNFEEIVASTAKLSSTPARPGEFSNLTLSDDQPHTLTVIALDTVNTPFLDQYTGRRELVKYLASSIDSGHVLALMIITSHGLKVVHGLTGDPAQLAAVLKKVGSELPALAGVGIDAQANAAAGDAFTPTPISPGADPTAAMESFVEFGDSLYAQFQQANAIETTLNGFLGIAWSLSGFPGRKSLIWATGGFPFTISSPATVPGGYLSALYERTMQALTEAQISIYPVDVRGLVNSSPIVSANRSKAPSMQTFSNRSWLQMNTIQTLNEFAEMTGGKAFYNTNDLATSFKLAADDGSSYYLLSYYLNLHDNHAGWRKLKVKVDRGDTEVRARKGFFVTNATLHMDITRQSDLNFALTSPIEGTGVPLSVKWLRISGDGPTKKAEFSIRMPSNGLSFEAGGQNRLNFDYAVAAYADKSKDGKPANSIGKSLTSTVTQAEMPVLQAKGVGLTNTLDLAPGQYSVRFVVRDNVTGKIGSVTAPLTVN